MKIMCLVVCKTVVMLWCGIFERRKKMVSMSLWGFHMRNHEAINVCDIFFSFFFCWLDNNYNVNRKMCTSVVILLYDRVNKKLILFAMCSPIYKQFGAVSLSCIFFLKNVSMHILYITHFVIFSQQNNGRKYCANIGYKYRWHNTPTAQHTTIE